ncbi:hypothetical protein AX768_02065 [Burkholderia sp. PAMC 28687]|uniref:hypothetical protein n=1 Tax=Burkholderia sp. PAMC 28687 TaxID=1795874 RepID=UPI000780DAC5|nr:hypothetical protein [Burkholderia sp. PAMC 28687]AMM13075.1 hypothetical protein AX768_02065 [Burkholderia sp. PAMC 28687]
MSNFAEVDREYRKAIAAPGRELLAAFDAARSVKHVDWGGVDITNAILLRVKAFSDSQQQIKAGLSKGVASAAADIFVECVCFYLKIAVERQDLKLIVASEKAITTGRKALRPDITVWREGSLIAAIECKTQLGWNRNGWRDDFNDREARLRLSFPGAKLFLLVLTGGNWPGFADDSRLGHQFFLLLRDKWYGEFDLPTDQHLLFHSVEQLFLVLFSHAANTPASPMHQTTSSPSPRIREASTHQGEIGI